MHLVGFAFSFAIFITGVLSAAVPAKDPTAHRLAKRDVPFIGEGIHTDNSDKGGKLLDSDSSTSGALHEAFELLDYAISASDDAVFAKYFNPEDKQVVMDVFSKLLGEHKTGAAELAQITVDAIEGPAASECFAYPDPDLILTQDAW
ncbi:MAG: hypothetical protein Q9195_006003 [Heterodermia aff. obscurata]